VSAQAAIERAFRRDAARAIATLARALGDLGAAEDAVQEAYLIALERFTDGALPANPAGRPSSNGWPRSRRSRRPTSPRRTR